MRRFLLLCLLLPFGSHAEEKRCAVDPVPAAGSLLIVNNVNGGNSSDWMNERIREGEIRVETDPKVLTPHFREIDWQAGDCIWYRKAERFTASLRRPWFGGKIGRTLPRWGSPTEVIPVVYRNARDHSRHYGVVAAKTLPELKAAPYREGEWSALEAFNPPAAKDLTIVYVRCPPDRREVCRLTVRDRGQFVLDPKTKRRWEIPVLAKSFYASETQRVAPNGDTPQGIYYVWATMISPGKRFGGQPRLDLDASLPTLNGLPYALHSLVLDALVPPAQREDYWLHEWPLAFHFGRTGIRIHSSTHAPEREESYTTPRSGLTFRLTAGCINTGTDVFPLLRVLENGGAVRIPTPGPTMAWEPTPRLGKVFVVVKDDPSL